MRRGKVRPHLVRLIALSLVAFSLLYYLATHYVVDIYGYGAHYDDDAYGFIVPPDTDPSEATQGAKDPNELTKSLVVSAMKGDDVTWIQEYFPDWEHRIYIMNDPKAELTVQKNKGRESSAYLTYIIDHYDDLPMYSVFMHGLRYQWHNEDPMYDGVPVLKNLQLQHVLDEGYVNLRCTWMIGCPSELREIRQHSQPDPEEAGTMHTEHKDTRISTEAHFAVAYLELFPNTTPDQVPDMVGIPCGAQFALSRDRILKRPKSDYERYRNWLWETTLDDTTSGRILEYSWHIIMGKPAQHCPPTPDCFCKTFGLCNLANCTQDACPRRYKLPKWSTIPKGWPDNGPGEDGWPARDWYLDSAGQTQQQAPVGVGDAAAVVEGGAS